ncbi:MAG: hypothetical protein ACXWKM_04885 [Phenylobacterium sp.]
MSVTVETPSAPETSRELRRRADELKRRAAKARTPEVRLGYLELAVELRSFAERIEERVEDGQQPAPGKA